MHGASTHRQGVNSQPRGLSHGHREVDANEKRVTLAVMGRRCQNLISEVIKRRRNLAFLLFSFLSFFSLNPSSPPPTSQHPYQHSSLFLSSLFALSCLFRPRGVLHCSFAANPPGLGKKASEKHQKGTVRALSPIHHTTLLPVATSGQ